MSCPSIRMYLRTISEQIVLTIVIGGQNISFIPNWFKGYYEKYFTVYFSVVNRNKLLKITT